MQIEDLHHQNFSLLGKGANLEGHFHFSGILRVSSKIKGEIKMGSGDQLIIEPTGEIEGIVNCHDIDIYGKFNGKLNSKGRVIIRPGADVAGELHSQGLTIFPGAKVNISGETQ